MATSTPNKYLRVIKGAPVDFYDIARAFGVADPAIAHALKKILRYGCGEKPLLTDVKEAIWSLQRYVQDNPVPTNETPEQMKKRLERVFL